MAGVAEGNGSRIGQGGRKAVLLFILLCPLVVCLAESDRQCATVVYFFVN